MIYCDWAATALFDEEILKSNLEKSIILGGNPSSVHKFGLSAKKALSEARKKCANAIGVNEECIFFTSGGTESDHIPMVNLLTKSSKGSIVISNIEHPAVQEMAQNLKKCGWKVLYAKADRNGIVTPQNVLSVLQDDTDLVCIMAVNNEVGSIQPIYEIADALKEKSQGRKKPKFHVDCVQGAGKIPLNIGYDGIDSAAFSAHKIGGPRGSGILYLKDATSAISASFLKGGGQEKGVRSGTENLFGAMCMADCLEKYFLCKNDYEKYCTEARKTFCVDENMDENVDENKCDSETYSETYNKTCNRTFSEKYARYENQKILTEKFIQELLQIPGTNLIPEVRKPNDSRFSPWIIQCAFKNIPGEVMVRALSEKEIYISTGSACSSRKMKRPILEAIGISSENAQNGVRFSFGASTTSEQMEQILDAVKEITSLF